MSVLFRFDFLGRLEEILLGGNGDIKDLKQVGRSRLGPQK